MNTNQMYPVTQQFKMIDLTYFNRSIVTGSKCGGKGKYCLYKLSYTNNPVYVNVGQ